MYSFLVDNNGHIKAKGMNTNTDVTIHHNEYKNVLLKNKCLRHWLNRIQSKYHIIGTYEIKKVSWSCFNIYLIYVFKIYI